MSHRMDLEALMFKPVPTGFLFQAPKKWVLFGSSRRYVVSPAQKSAILDILAMRRVPLTVALTITAMLLWVLAVSVGLYLVSGHEDPAGSDMAVMTIAIVGPLLTALVLSFSRKIRRIQPILEAATPTAERITARDIRRAQFTAIPLRRALILAATWMLLAGCSLLTLWIGNAQHPLFGNTGSFLYAFNALIGTGLAGYYLVIAYSKRS